MHKSRLLQLMRSFQAEELRQLQLFLQSPYFFEKQVEELLALFSHIQAHLAEKDSPALDKKATYALLFPEQEWIVGKLEKLMTQLLQATHRFIGIHFATSPANLELPLTQFLQQRDLKANFDRVLLNWKKKIDHYTSFSSATLYEKFLLESLVVKNQEKQLSLKTELQLPTLLMSLDQYYLFTKLQYACQLLAINIFVMPVELGDSLKMLENMGSAVRLPHLRLPVIEVYYYAYLVLHSTPENRSEHFQHFKKLLYQHDDQLSIEQQKSLHTMIRNYAILQYHSGAAEYLQTVFDIYRDHLQRGFLYYQGKLLPLPFGNIVVFALRMEAYDWLFDFLKSHKNKITGTPEAELIYQFNLAHYYFHVRNYEQASALLPDHFKDLYYKIAARRLELKILFETESLILESKIEAFKIFIYRLPKTRITQQQKTANNHFIQIFRQIIHPKTAVNLTRIKKIQSKIQDLGHLSEKYWLLRILNRYQKAN